MLIWQRAAEHGSLTTLLMWQQSRGHGLTVNHLQEDQVTEDLKVPNIDLNTAWRKAIIHENWFSTRGNGHAQVATMSWEKNMKIPCWRAKLLWYARLACFIRYTCTWKSRSTLSTNCNQTKSDYECHFHMGHTVFLMYTYNFASDLKLVTEIVRKRFTSVIASWMGYCNQSANERLDSTPQK